MLAGSRTFKSAIGTILIFLLGSDAFAVGATGFATQLMGTKAMGQGNAFVAESDDPSAIYFNPAGITQLAGTQVTLGSTLLLPIVNRDGADAPEDEMKRELGVLPMAYVVHTMDLADDQKFSFGLGVHSPFGLTTEWAPTSSMRYVTTTSKFELIDVNPTLAFQVNPQLSIGIGADYMNLFNVETDAMINQQAVGGQDGTSKLTGHGDGWGYNAGVLYKPYEKHSFGVSYRSQVQIPISGSLELTNLDPLIQTMFNFNGATYSADATSSITLPQSVIGGYAFKPNSRWTLVADYEWTQWNVFQSQNIAIQESAPNRLALLTGNGSNVSTTVRDWHNVSAVGAGTNFKLNNAWQFRGGYAYYERTTPTQTFVPDVPDSAVHLVTLGFSRSWERLVFDFAFNGFFYADRNVTNTVGNNVGASINGTYTNFTPAISMSLTYKFGNLDSPRIP